MSLLRHPEGREVLLSRMDESIAELPLDFDNYEMRVQILTDLHGYVEGTYTIFPEKEEVEIEDGRQLSIFDFIDVSVSEPKPQESKKEKGKEIGRAETREALRDFGAEKEPEMVQDAETGKEQETVQKDEESIEIPKETEQEPSKEGLSPIFEYNGFHFEAVGELPNHTDTRDVIKNTISRNALGMSDYEDGKRPYSHDRFYDASTVKTADIFRCVETGKNFLPGEHELFEYVGEFIPYLQKKEKTITEPDKSEAGELGTEETKKKETVSKQNEPEGTESEILQEEPYAEEEILIENRLFLAMKEADVYLEDFSPEQVDVIYEAAEKDLNLVPMLNPDFSPEQMQLIADMTERMTVDRQAVSENALNSFTSHVMNLEEINNIRRDFLPSLEPEIVYEPDGIDQTENLHAPQEKQGKEIGGQEKQGRETSRQEPLSETAGQEKINFHITNDDLGAGGPKQKFRANMDAIYLLKELEAQNRLATKEEQETLSHYVGWGGIPKAFDDKDQAWAAEYAELKAALSPEEYRQARASTLNAFYTSPTVIKAMYEALGNMGLKEGNVLEPSCAIGNFMGLVPDTMDGIKMYGVELDSISGKIAGQLYQKNNISIQGFETVDYPDSFFDCVIGNVPFGAYKVADKRYDRHNFMIHDYFIAKSLDLVRPGGVVAVVTSSGTMDKQNPNVRQYIANRADLLGAIRLPENAFK